MTASRRIIRMASQRAGLCRAVVVLACVSAGVCGAAEPEADSPTITFEDADRDQDGTLTADELCSVSQDPKTANRDFNLFDFDQNGRLTRNEFAAIPGFMPETPGGLIPDPMDHLVDAAVEAMEESLKRAVDDDSVTVPVRVFIRYVVQTMSPDGTAVMGSETLQQIDSNRDGSVSSGEARRYVERQLGLRAPTGEQLRANNGSVVAFGLFQQLDVDQNDQLEPEEWEGGRETGAPRQEFEALDHDRSGSLTLDEFDHAEGGGRFHPIAWFRDADTDLDVRLSRSEAAAATESSREVLIEPSFRAFDVDRDDKLTLDEFRLSMLGNPVVCWEQIPFDENDDDRLSFDEFKFGRTHCGLLRLFHFHRLDADGDNELSPEEYRFRRRPPQKLHMLAADGSEFREVFVNDKYGDIGSPAVSPDGKRIAFDGHLRGQGLQQQQILMTSIDGTGFRAICHGLMPTWSKDGKQFACSRYRPHNSGIWIINADGSGEKRISDGWGAQWSPDGENIAFTRNNGLWVYEVATGKFREILSAVENPFRTIYWNMNWSPESRRLAFKARKDRGFAIASVDMGEGGPDLRVHYVSRRSINADVAWTPDGTRILASLELPAEDRQLLCEIDISTDDPPKVVEGIDRSLTYAGCSFTPDGKWIIMQTEE